MYIITESGHAKGKDSMKSMGLYTLRLCTDHLVMLAQPKNKVAPLSDIYSHDCQPMSPSMLHHQLLPWFNFVLPSGPGASPQEPQLATNQTFQTQASGKSKFDLNLLKVP